MINFSMTCSDGHTMTVDAASREEAVTMIRAGFTQAELDEHYRSHHSPSETKPTLEQAHAMIDQIVAAA